MRLAREIWVNIVEQYERSGVTQEAFAEERQIPVATLRAWIYRLRRERQEVPAVLPVRVVPSPAPPARQRSDEAAGIEIESGEVRLRFPAGTRARLRKRWRSSAPMLTLPRYTL